MPINVHSESAWHGLHSWFDVGTHTYVTSPSVTAPTTPRQPQPSGHVPHSSLHTPPVLTRMQISDWHCMLSVHDSPKPLSGASGGASITTAPTASIGGVDASAHEVVLGSHSLLRVEVAHAASTTSPPSRMRPIIDL